MDQDTIEVPELQLRGSFTCDAAPVQVEGTVAQHAFYFRARHEKWSFSVSLSPEVDPADICFPSQGFFREGPYGSGRFAASYMPLDEARRIVTECVKDFLHSRTA